MKSRRMWWCKPLCWQRPSLHRCACLFLLAVGSLLAFSYLPLARIRAANVGATVLPSAGKPLVNLKKNAQTVKIAYTGDGASALQSGAATPTSLAAADFNADGAMDVVAGFSSANGGVVAVLLGNRDAYAPTDPTLYTKAMQGSVPATFQSKAATFIVPESPDFIATGDFNRDGHQDVLVAARGSNLYLMAGDGTGHLLAPQLVPLTGQVTAMAADYAGRVAVGLNGPSGAEVAILSPSSSGLVEGARYPLPARGDSVAWGSLGGGADVAVGAGSHVVIVYNALSASPQTETVTVPFQVMGLALGDFIWDRDGRTEIAALADDGSVQILQHGTLNTAPLTSADLPARAAAIRGRKTAAQKAALKAQTLNPTALGAWTVAQQLPYPGTAPGAAVSPSGFSSPHLAASTTHDVMVIDVGRNQLSILDTSGKTASPSAAVSFTGAPIAALALPQKINANRDLVVLTSAQSAPTIITADSSDPIYNVNTTSDGDAVDACTNSSVTTLPTTLTLREAVCIANNNAPGTFVINVPAGTYSLSNTTDAGTGELRTGTVAANENLSIIGAGQSSTIILQTDGVDRILTQDYTLYGNNPVAISNLTMQGGFCTDQSDPNDPCGYGGGAILGGGEAGSDLTLTNVTMTNNQANPTGNTAGGGQDQGGAISFEGPNLTITSSTFSSNVASGAGGAIYAEEGLTLSEVVIPGTWTITSSTFTNNKANGVGGGIILDLNDGTVGSASSTASITGSTFTGNKVTNNTNPGGGMGIYAGPFTMSNSRITGNVAPGGGNGVYFEDITTATITDNWWGCNGGPGASGCDAVDQVGGGTVTDAPYLVLSISANPTEIAPNTGTSTLTADLTHNSSGTGGFSVPDRTPVAFGGTLGTDNPTGAPTASGQATSTYTAGSTAGNDSGVSATVDNATADTTINILDSVTVTTSPASLSITVDSVNYTAPQTFNWVVGSSHTLNTTSPQDVSGGSEYVWSSWSQGGTQSQTIDAPTATTTYTATFNTQYQLTTQASPSADGTVSSGGYYAGGATIAVMATANAGFQFTSWSSTGGTFDSSTTATTNFHMPSAATTVTANFSPLIVAASTSTVVQSSPNPSFTAPPNNSVTFTATVTSTSTVNEGTVTFTDSLNILTCSGGNTVAVSGGEAQCLTSFTTEGTDVITATYSGTVNFLTSSGMVSQGVNNHTVVTGDQFCNPGAITVPSTAGAATPYPSNIFVSGFSANLSAVTVQLNNISSSDIARTDLLLVGPTGAAIVPFAAVGDGSTISGVNITLDDAAASLIPGGSPLTSGTYRPTSITGSTTLAFPAPAPSITAANYAATDGTATLAEEFAGTSANGTWALYAMDNSGGGAATIGSGWCVTITAPTPAVSVTKSVTSSGPYNAVGQTISYQFVATNTGNVNLTAVGIADNQTSPAGTLTSGPTCQSLSGPAGTCSGSTTTLTPGQSATFTATYTITQADLNNGSVNDSATASGSPPTGSAVASQPSPATVTTTSSPGLTVAKSVASSGPYNAVGQTVTYQFVAKNTGNVTLTAVGITDTQAPPAGALTTGPTCQSLSSPTGTCSGSTATLLPGQSATFTASYTLTQADLNNGSVSDSATASGKPPSGSAVASPPSAATVTTTSKPTITKSPTSQTICQGKNVTFTAAATGVPAPTVQWQVSPDGVHWFNIPGATSASLTFPAILAANGTEYRAVFTNTFGSTATNAATLTVDFAPQITAQPSDQHVKKGQSVTFTAAASGRPTPTVQWQVSTNGGKTWSNISGATSTTLKFTATAAQDENHYRAVFTNTCGTATTRAALLDVD